MSTCPYCKLSNCGDHEEMMRVQKEFANLESEWDHEHPFVDTITKERIRGSRGGHGKLGGGGITDHITGIRGPTGIPGESVCKRKQAGIYFCPICGTNNCKDYEQYQQVSKQMARLEAEWDKQHPLITKQEKWKLPRGTQGLPGELGQEDPVTGLRGWPGMSVCYERRCREKWYKSNDQTN